MLVRNILKVDTKQSIPKVLKKTNKLQPYPSLIFQLSSHKDPQDMLVSQDAGKGIVEYHLHNNENECLITLTNGSIFRPKSVPLNKSIHIFSFSHYRYSFYQLPSQT